MKAKIGKKNKKNKKKLSVKDLREIVRKWQIIRIFNGTFFISSVLHLRESTNMI